MLGNISWSFYWTVIVIGLLIYYSVLFVLLYKSGLFSKIKFTTVPSRSQKPEPAGNPQPNLFGFESLAVEISGGQASQLPGDDKILMPLVHDLINELKGFITGIAERSFIKEEVVIGIQLIVNSYKNLEGSSYQKSINDFIKTECEDYCSIHLSEEDIKRIWIG